METLETDNQISLHKKRRIFKSYLLTYILGLSQLIMTIYKDSLQI